MTDRLNSQTINTSFNVSSSVYQGGGAFKLEVPQSSVTVAKPLTYDFRVAEYVDESDKVVRVGLQFRIWEHDNHGYGRLAQDWKDVERVKVTA